MELLTLLFQALAILALIGIVVVLIFAIIEPGPLVKKRPFARKSRQESEESEER